MASQTHHRVRVSPHVLAAALIALGAASLSIWPGHAAQAQLPPLPPIQVPNGSYQASCNNIRASTSTADPKLTLTADCRKSDGTSVPARLVGFEACKGDISNNDGNLQCPTGFSAAPKPPPLAPQQVRQQKTPPDFTPKNQAQGRLQ
jgi:hypothetical protein